MSVTAIEFTTGITTGLSFLGDSSITLTDGAITHWETQGTGQCPDFSVAQLRGTCGFGSSNNTGLDILDDVLGGDRIMPISHANTFLAMTRSPAPGL